MIFDVSLIRFHKFNNLYIKNALQFRGIFQISKIYTHFFLKINDLNIQIYVILSERYNST
jgi:hypothetical protein